ncbi:PRC-barrel domain-containing protein [Spirosoma spitsbergense]|uniref:PRC-barrel domain-containing protein n=1 Tax=Spirosoma spitsbergense TaxID=431554 RepID=UPI00036D37E9|nr:PRC-barrel domain-containing protein [Spirosoma spitsbergense]
MAEYENRTDRDDLRSAGNTLYRLSELDDYKVADHSADIRSWAVKSRDGKTIGRVKDLLVDPVARKVRYIDLKLDDEFLANTDTIDINLLVPVGAARLDADDDNVFIDRITTTDELRYYPRSTGRALTREYERAVVNYHTGLHQDGPGSSADILTNNHPNLASGSQGDPIIAYDRSDDDVFYNQDCFKTESLYQNRPIK